MWERLCELQVATSYRVLILRACGILSLISLKSVCRFYSSQIQRKKLRHRLRNLFKALQLIRAEFTNHGSN